MKTLEHLLHFSSGSPQFRIQESQDEQAPVYTLYAQHHLNADLSGMQSNPLDNKTITTLDDLSTLAAGDIVFSLISGTAAIVSANHAGYVQTQNYIKLLPSQQIDRKFLVYLLNEDKQIKRQWAANLQGTSLLKYTLAQLKSLQINSLPTLEKQEIIGNVYLAQLHIQALRQRVAELETKRIFALLAGVAGHE